MKANGENICKVLTAYARKNGLRTKGDAHAYSFKVFVDNDDDMGYVATAIGMICRAFYGFNDMIEIGNGCIDVVTWLYPFLDEIDEVELADVCPTYKEVLD